MLELGPALGSTLTVGRLLSSRSREYPSGSQLFAHGVCISPTNFGIVLRSAVAMFIVGERRAQLAPGVILYVDDRDLDLRYAPGPLLPRHLPFSQDCSCCPSESQAMPVRLAGVTRTCYT